MEELLLNSYQELLHTYGIRYFRSTEVFKPFVVHPLGSIPEDNLWINSIPTLLVLDECRDFCGFPIKIISSFRNDEHNWKEGGSESSLHKEFNAFDIKPVSGKPSHLEKMKLFFEDVFFYKIMFDDYSVTKNDLGYGIYHNRLHIDTRGVLGRPSPVDWTK